MTIDQLKQLLADQMVYMPTDEQRVAIDTFCRFLACREPQPVMVMRGAAGTGKTTLAAAFVRTMVKLKQKVMLLAPTGRAAKVLSQHSGMAAYTIHRKIYRQKAFTGDMSGFLLAPNLMADTLFVVDEASMVANEGVGEARFGSGRLLDDLMAFVYTGTRCRLLLMGDKAQLPPVGEEESPALSTMRLQGYGLTVFEAELDQVLRQNQQSGILYNATTVRRMITDDMPPELPKVRFQGFTDIEYLPGNELIETLYSSYSKVGTDETMVITRSNQRANIYNQGIRGRVLDREETLSSGDLVMLVKNNYYWTEQLKSKMPFLANGDRARVVKVRNYRSFYGFKFADADLVFPDYDDEEITATVLLDTLTTDVPALTKEQQERLFQGVYDDYFDVTVKSERMKKVKDDTYFNALQLKFAYAGTCHKAQGGQWAHVYVDQGYMTDDMLNNDYLHWLYTAFTRATEKLYLVNWPKTQTETA